MLDGQSNKKKKKIDALIILHQKAVKPTTILLQNMKAKKKKKNDTLVILHKINVKTINFTTKNLQTNIAMNVINLILTT